MYTFKILKTTTYGSFPYEVKVYKNGYLICIRSLSFFSGKWGISDTNFLHLTFDSMEEAYSCFKASFDPFKDALDRVNKSIDENVAKMNHTMHLRMAKFRGDLFAQITHIKYGYSQQYRNYLLDSFIESVKKL